MHQYLQPGYCIDRDHPAVGEFDERMRAASRDPLERAVHNPHQPAADAPAPSGDFQGQAQYANR